jgi:beta-lactamase regulating signal transducer with metallopeptidase domain
MATRREDVRWLDSPVAVSLTAGLLRPQVYLSSGMAARLSATELAAAVAHEHCHARERHGLWKLLAASLGSLHLPGVRRRLLELVDLACERRADEAAAARVGDRVHVASAIVRAHRVAPDLASPLVLALSRGGHNLSLRVRALLDDEVASAPASHRWALAAIAALLASSHAIHHGVEHVLSLLV